MIGAWKINNKTDDLDRLFDLMKAGYSDYRISTIYKTNSGHTLSRSYISRIRRGVQWNEQRRSFYMKDELKSFNIITSEIGNSIYRTEVGVVLSKTLELYVYLTFKNDRYDSNIISPLMVKKPSYDELFEFHKNNIPSQ